MSHSLILPVFNSPRLPSLAAVSGCCRLSARHFVGFINSASPSSRVITLHDSPFPFPAVSLSLSPGPDASPVSQTVGGTAASQSKYFVIVVVFFFFFLPTAKILSSHATQFFFFPKQKNKCVSKVNCTTVKIIIHLSLSGMSHKLAAAFIIKRYLRTGWCRVAFFRFLCFFL